MKLKIGVILIFLGSVFLTSENFINTENTVKFYISIFGFFIGIILILLQKGKLKFEITKITSLNVIKGLYIVGVFQSIYGLLQYVGKFPSNHSSFAITGSFDNPAGFVAVLSMLFPIGVFWSIKSKKLEQRLVFFSTGLILFTIIISGSRAGLLAAIISMISVFNIEFQLFHRIRTFNKIKLLTFCTIVIVLLGAAALYKWKPNSVHGRLLIWDISLKMIIDKPIWGFGSKGFQADYMNYQAQYFEHTPNQIFIPLADNVLHPFNEFIKITVNHGIIGLILFVSLTIFMIRRIIKFSHSQKSIFLGGFISFIILSLFSYPLQYAPIWFLLCYFTLCVLSDLIPLKNIPLAIKIPIISLSLFSIIFFSFRMHYELKWKEIASKSLRGKTTQMLKEYEKIYPSMKYNSFFLYNYSAELNVSQQYKKSIIILNQCLNKYNDYDVQMLFADNYIHLSDTAKAIETYKYAENMIPCRFLPLYHIFNIYKTSGQNERALKYAKLIINKEVKIPSATVATIKYQANEFIENYETNE